MSDFILKLWPEEDTQEDKTNLIKSEFKNLNIVGEETEFWGKPAFKGGEKLHDFFGPKWEQAPQYFSSGFVKISEADYGVEEGPEDFEYINRKNVVSVLGLDGTVEEWSAMCSELERITGNKYKGGWELL